MTFVCSLKMSKTLVLSLTSRCWASGSSSPGFNLVKDKVTITSCFKRLFQSSPEANVNHLSLGITSKGAEARMGTGANIIVFLGSTRDGRMVDRVWKFIKPKVEEREMNPILFDPLEMKFEMLRMPLHFMPDPTQAPQWMQDANKKIQEADGFLILTPEYNCSLPPALTNMLDHFSPSSYKHRPCGIISYSASQMGGSRASTISRPFLSELGMITVPAYTVIPTVGQSIDDKGGCSNETIEGSVGRVLDEVKWYAAALSNQKQIQPPPTK